MLLFFQLVWFFVRANYIQFDECDNRHARVKSAWFGVIPVYVKNPKAVEPAEVHVSVQEVVIPSKSMTHDC